MSDQLLSPAVAASPIVMLDGAHLCQDCTAIAAAPNGCCIRCGSKAVLAMAGVLNRKRNYSGACWNELMTNETKESLAELYIDLLRRSPDAVL